MEDLVQLYEIAETYPRILEQLTEEWLVKLRVILRGQSAVPAATKEEVKDLQCASPRQTNKRVKRLSSLNEEETEAVVTPQITNNNNHTKVSNGGSHSPRKSKRSNATLLAIADTMENSENPDEPDVVPRKKSLEEEKTEPTAERKSEATNLMPPPPVPVTAAAANATVAEEVPSGRPQRAAKLKSEKCLKEPKLNAKIRRPTDENVKVKLEHEQRASQIHEKAAASAALKKASISSEKSNESIVIVPGKKQAPVEISSNSEDDEVVRPTADTVPKEKKSASELSKKEEDIATKQLPEVSVRLLRVKIKSEKLSIHQQEGKAEAEASKDDTFKAPEPVPLPMATVKSKNSTITDNSVSSSSILSATTNTSTVSGKKLRKKKDAPPHRPIKVERFSDLDPKPSPIASRTRHGSMGKRASEGQEEETVPEPEVPVTEESKRAAGSIYEDAVETPPSRNSKTAASNETVNLGPVPAANETVNLGPIPAADATMNLGSVPGDATFCTNQAQTTFQVAPEQTTFVLDAANPNATVTLNTNSGAMCDATFDIHMSGRNDKDDDNAGQRSFETAKDSSMTHNSLLTEDESCEHSPPVPVKQKKPSAAKAPPTSASAKVSNSAKTNYKMAATRTNELFNPLAQSPVKMRVEAFENAAAAAATEQPKRPMRNKKENVTPTNATTPVIGKLPAPALGRFLTPTQSSNVSLAGSAYAKKIPTSASKAVPLLKPGCSSLQRSNSSTTAPKTLQRENSADDFRKNLHNLAEERKKQREQKHLLAAQQREAKERERAERVAKLAKEREEKRIQKQQEKLEQQKREMEEIQRKLRMQQEEEARLRAAKEREMLMQMKQQQQMNTRHRMLPPPPKTTLKYTFEMLHEDDSTDDECKNTPTRPPPPSWSLTKERGPYVLMQEYTPSSYIDSFFSVQPMTPDLKQIFPNIDARHLKRNSSVLWSTPPRYSELPKY